MEVKDIIKDELTEEEKTLLELDIKKKKYKLLTAYLESKECKALTKKYVKIWDNLLKDIEDELDKRRKGTSNAKATKSDLDKTLFYYDFLIKLISDLWDSEAEMILKEDLGLRATNTYSWVLHTVDPLYDVPSFSDLDMIKHIRAEYTMIHSQFETMQNNYFDKPNVVPNLNPYEEETEEAKEFNAATDVS